MQLPDSFRPKKMESGGPGEGLDQRPGLWQLVSSLGGIDLEVAQQGSRAKSAADLPCLQAG
jgi:hypothetical protein